MNYYFGRQESDASTGSSSVDRGQVREKKRGQHQPPPGTPVLTGTCTRQYSGADPVPEQS